MGRLSQARLGDVLPVLDRYRPVALSTAAILVIVAVLPGADVGAGGGAAAAPALPFNQASTGPTDLAVPGEHGAAVADEPVIDPPPLATPVPSLGRTSTGAGASTGGSAPDVGRSSSPMAARSSDDDPPDDRPLVPTLTAWATQAAGTPLGELGVPEGSLPVGTRLARTDKASFVRLTGDESTLVLTEAADGNRGSGAVVQACAVTESGWEGGGGQSFDDAPAWDAGSCTLGTRSGDGEWTFALGSLGEPDDPRGYALVPGAGAPPDFQVAFSTGT